MSYLIYFAAIGWLYGCIDRYDVRATERDGPAEAKDTQFVWLSFGTLVVFVPLSLGILSFAQDWPRAILVGLVFLVATMVPKRFFPRHPGEAALSTDGTVVSTGIIDIVWLTIMAGVLVAVVFFQGSGILATPIPAVESPSYGQLGENLRFFLGEILGAVLATGGVLTACMAILWAGEIWRSKEPNQQRVYRGTIRAAAKMVFAFFASMAGALWWMAAPVFLMALELSGT